LSTVPGMTVFGRSEILAVSNLSSAILADFDMRGSAISVWTMARIALPDSLVCFFMDLFRETSLWRVAVFILKCLDSLSAVLHFALTLS
jgi:hypothetical protein